MRELHQSEEVPQVPLLFTSFGSGGVLVPDRSYHQRALHWLSYHDELSDAWNAVHRHVDNIRARRRNVRVRWHSNRQRLHGYSSLPASVVEKQHAVTHVQRVRHL